MSIQASVKNDSSIYRMIAASGMSEHDRQHAVDALRNANLFVDGVMWTVHKIEDLAHFFVQPAVKH